MNRIERKGMARSFKKAVGILVIIFSLTSLVCSVVGQLNILLHAPTHT